MMTEGGNGRISLDLIVERFRHMAMVFGALSHFYGAAGAAYFDCIWLAYRYTAQRA